MSNKDQGILFIVFIGNRVEGGKPNLTIFKFSYEKWQWPNLTIFKFICENEIPVKIPVIFVNRGRDRDPGFWPISYRDRDWTGIPVDL